MNGLAGRAVYGIDRQMAPEAQYPLNQCVTVYRNLVTTHNPARIIGISNSCGGALMLAMMLKAREQDLPMIRALGLMTPASDITGDGDSGVSNDGTHIVTRDQSLMSVKLYVGTANPRDPFLSPIYGTYDNMFPATA
jgi:acetyl esterase/lipase